MQIDVPQDRNVIAGARKNLVCAVCGDLASGHNFGAIVCESCKSFYRRHCLSRGRFCCSANGMCQLNRSNRRFCAACRLRKCYEVGMKKHAWTDDQEETAASLENKRRRSLIKSRLQQRIAARSSSVFTSSSSTSRSISTSSVSETEADSSDQVSNANSTVADTIALANFIKLLASHSKSIYEILSVRIATATNILLVGARSKPESSFYPLDSDCVALAFGPYIKALKLFPELVQLDASIHRQRLSNRLLNQINILSFFTINSEMNGWLAVDSNGAFQEHQFDEFLNSVAQDGADASSFIAMLRNLVQNLRRLFPNDWPWIALMLCLLDYCSPATESTHSNCDYRLTELHEMFSAFLYSYLNNNYEYNARFLFSFCMDVFPKELARIVDVQTLMLNDGIAAAKPHINSGFRHETQTNAAARLATLFLPIASEVAALLVQ